LRERDNERAHAQASKSETHRERKRQRQSQRDRNRVDVFFMAKVGRQGGELPEGQRTDGKLVDNFTHESDVTSLQDPFTSRP